MVRSVKARKGERGVSIVLVAVCLAALMAMAALAIDVVTLYVARTEAQRASDASALAGARMIAASGYTSSGISWNGGDSTPLCATGGPGAAAAANQQAEAVAAQNVIAGHTASVLQITCNMSAGNPTIAVTTQRTNLPTFFARIWGRTASSVSATSTAEAYNPSWLGGSTPPPIAVSVKPWLLPNCDPYNVGPANANCTAAGNSGATFFDPTTGAPENNASYIGNATPITLSHLANNTRPSVGGSPGPPTAKYYRMDVPINPPNAVCPSAPSGNDYQDNIECSSTFQVSCGQQIGLSASPLYTVLTTAGLNPRTDSGIETLIHASGTGLGQNQDIFAPTGSGPVTITAGANNPNFAGLGSYASISRSDSIVTVPIYDGRQYNTGTGQFCAPGPTNCTATDTIIGFAQLALADSDGNGAFKAYILNVVGCPASGPPPAVTGGGVSAIPVRLVHQ